MLFYTGTDGTTTLGDAWWLSLEDISLPETSDLVTLSDLEKQLAVQQQPAAPQQAPAAPRLGNGVPVGPLAGVNGSYWAALPTQLQTVVPQLANTAITTLKGRLGYPAAGDGSDLTATATATPGLPGGGGFILPTSDAIDDDALLALGRSFLGVDTTREELVFAAREYFSTVAPSELKLGSVATLMTDYRRVSRAGWAAAVATLGPEALLHTDTLMIGRYMHWAAEDVRMKDVGLILEDYKGLLSAAAATARGDDDGVKEDAVEDQEEQEEEEEDSFISGPPPSEIQQQ